MAHRQAIISFLLYLLSRTLEVEQRVPTQKPLPHSSRTFPHLSRFSLFFVHLHLLYSIAIAGTPEVTGHRYYTNIELADTRPISTVFALSSLTLSCPWTTPSTLAAPTLDTAEQFS